jgi:hypothetical protein
MLMEALIPPPSVVPPLYVAPLPLTFLLPFAKLVLGVIIAPLGPIIPLVMET